MSRAHLRLGVLGGTLDPVHAGHLAAARAAIQALALDTVWLMPAHVPVGKPSPAASPWHRFAMAALAVADDDRLAVSDLELSRPGPSYTFDTLRALHEDGYAASQIFFITGIDAFAEIAAWYCFPEVLDQAHFAIVTRPGHHLAPTVTGHPALASRFASPETAHATAAGNSTDSCRIWTVDADTPLVSSTDIRTRILHGQEVGTDVPPSVAGHIRRHGLYTSTRAARRLHGED